MTSSTTSSGSNSDSPLFGKSHMTTFERFFLEGPETHREVKDPYLQKIKNANFVRKNGWAFVIDQDVLVINGHVPIKIEKEEEEDPLKQGDNAVNIHDAFSKPYGDHSYTLVMGPYVIHLAGDSHFESIHYFIDKDDNMIPKL
ncbi:MAG: fructose-bisphosphatase class III [Akkermansiaceae bacterium]